MQITQMDLINANIEYHAQGLSNKDVTRNILNEWRGSKVIRDMKEAQAYYEVKNTAIEAKNRNYEDENGNIIKNDHLSNIKSKSAQYRKSVNQKVNFALAKPFTVSCDNEKYRDAWNDFLDRKTRDAIIDTGIDGINKGIGWSYIWIDDKGELRLLSTEPETVYPAWKDRTHSDMDCLVRDYKVLEYKDTLSPEEITKVEYWDDKVSEKYIDYGNGLSSGDLVPDTNGEFELGEAEEDRTTIQHTHMVGVNGEGISWDKIPFIFFKGCRDELPLLNECKSDIDAYDMLKSKSIDSLLDDIDPILIVEDISPEMGELTRARKLLQNSRIMSVDRGGNAHYEKVDTNVSQTISELDMIRKDVQDNTSTVDLTTIQLGTNPSGNSMKAFYENLNTWCNGFEAQFEVYMENLKYFFDKWLSWKGGYGTFEQLQAIPVSFSLDRDMMINESDILSDVQKMQGILSQQTLDEMNPWVESHDIEEQRREEDEEKAKEKQELFQFGKDIDESEEYDKEDTSKTNEKDKINEENE